MRARRKRSYSDDDGAVFDIDHQRLDLTFDPARLWVSGRASVQLHITAISASSLTIRLAQPLAVASVSSATLGDLLALRIIGQNTILVGLPDLVERGATIVLDVVYGGRLEPQPLDREAIQVQGQRSTESGDINLGLLDSRASVERAVGVSGRGVWQLATVLCCCEQRSGSQRIEVDSGR
jgi:hypothetical protein